jgi:putative flippase GtrA
LADKRRIGALMRQLAAFGLVGVANTAIGFGTIALAQNGLGLHPVAANVLGYAVGLSNSYIMNRAFTFRGARHSTGQALRFLAAFAIAYAINLGVLLAGLALAPEAALGAQAAAMVAYTLAFFALSKIYVFREAA